TGANTRPLPKEIYMMKKLRFAALAGVLGMSFLSLKPAETFALTPATFCRYNSCWDGKPCSVDEDCGCFESGALAGICTRYHTCVCR
ncbi:MAG TPA: hypothetical protein VIW92_07110, partial [Thermoanaerobaculia bacterium]